MHFTQHIQQGYCEQDKKSLSIIIYFGKYELFPIKRNSPHCVKEQQLKTGHMVQKCVASTTVNGLEAKQPAKRQYCATKSMQLKRQAMTQVAKRNKIATYVLPQPSKHTACVSPNNKNICFCHTFLLLRHTSFKMRPGCENPYHVASPQSQCGHGITVTEALTGKCMWSPSNIRWVGPKATQPVIQYSGEKALRHRRKGSCPDMPRGRHTQRHASPSPAHRTMLPCIQVRVRCSAWDVAETAAGDDAVLKSPSELH